MLDDLLNDLGLFYEEGAHDANNEGKENKLNEGRKDKNDLCNAPRLYTVTASRTTIRTTHGLDAFRHGRIFAWTEGRDLMTRIANPIRNLIM